MPMDWRGFGARLHFMLANSVCVCVLAARELITYVIALNISATAWMLDAMMNNFHIYVLDAVLSSQNSKKIRCSFTLCDQPDPISHQMLRCSYMCIIMAGRSSIGCTLSPQNENAFISLLLRLATLFTRVHPQKNTIANALQSIYYTLWWSRSE